MVALNQLEFQKRVVVFVEASPHYHCSKDHRYRAGAPSLVVKNSTPVHAELYSEAVRSEMKP